MRNGFFANFRRNRPATALSFAQLGQVLTQGLVLYRRHWRDYSLLALRAYAWLWLPIFGWSRYGALKAAIARHAFAQLCQAPIDLKTAQIDMQRSRSKLFWLSLRITWDVTWKSLLCHWVTLVGVTAIAVVSMLLLSWIPQLDEGQASEQIGGFIGLLLATLIYPVTSLWLYSKTLYAEPQLATNPEQSIAESMAASQTWAAGNGLGLLGLLLTLLAISFPIASLTALVMTALDFARSPDSVAALQLAGVPFVLVLLFNSPLLLATLAWADLVESIARGTLGETLLSAIAFNLPITIAAAFMLALWQTVKASLLYQQRCHTEGLDIQLSRR
jgi:hypothetical protein